MYIGPNYTTVKTLLLFSFAMISICVHGQISIVSADLPQPGDVLVTRTATLTGTFDGEDTGADHVWNFESDVLQLTGVTTSTNCIDVASTPFTFQFLFNNPFDPNHNSDFAQGVESFTVATLEFSDAYQYFKNSNGKYAITGLGANINGVPLASQKNGIEMLFHVPLQFGNSGTSQSELSFEIPTFGSYVQDLTREYDCDGEGTLNILGQSHEVLRVKSVVNAEDSLYVDFFQNGIQFPEPEVITYEWYSPNYKVPVLDITLTQGVVSSVQVADIFETTGIAEQPIVESFAVYPNPVKDLLWIKLPLGTNATIILTNSEGKELSRQQNGTPVIDMTQYASGLYFVKIITSGGVQTNKILKN